MNFQDLNPPITEFPSNQNWYRVQRRSARRDSVRMRGYLLAPPGGLAGRFDLADEPTAYLGDTPETALYESLFRREARSCHWDRLVQRDISSFLTIKRLRLVDLRGLEERYPVLQSLRYESTQDFALDCRSQEIDGIVYASAQHPQHSCLCLFKAGIDKTKRLSSTPLVKPGTDQLHSAVVGAARGSQVPIVRE